MRPRRAWLGFLLGLGLAACGQESPSSGKPLVVATFYPLYEFARQVTGDRAEVVSLVPSGVEPHDWEPAPQDVARIQKARLFVYNGAGLEPWADSLLRGFVDRARAVNTTEGLPLASADLPRHGDEDADEAHGGDRKRTAAALDPHVWLDPVLARAQVERILTGLERADPGNADAYRENARVFHERLGSLHAAFEQGLRQCARRDIVVSHAAFGYLARRYGLTVVPIMGLAPESEPSPAQLATIVEFARRRKVRYIFFETLVSPKLAETVAREIGAGTLVLNPIEGVTKEERAAGKGYLALMKDNLTNLRVGLECR